LYVVLNNLTEYMRQMINNNVQREELNVHGVSNRNTLI